MKFNEFEKDARKQLAEKNNLSQDQLDEILPAIAAIARGAGAAAGAAGRVAAKGGAALARGAAKAGASAARGAGRLAAKGATSAVKTAAKSIGGRNNDEPQTNDPNATVGSQADAPTPMGSTGTQGTTGTKPTGTQTSPVKQGKTIRMPAGTAKKPTNFKITKVQGDDVEIENPLPKPGEPKKFTYKKQDLEGVLGDETK